MVRIFPDAASRTQDREAIPHKRRAKQWCPAFSSPHLVAKLDVEDGDYEEDHGRKNKDGVSHGVIILKGQEPRNDLDTRALYSVLCRPNLQCGEPFLLLGGGSHFGMLRSLRPCWEVDQWSARPGSLGRRRIAKENNLRSVRAS